MIFLVLEQLMETVQPEFVDITNVIFKLNEIGKLPLEELTVEYSWVACLTTELKFPPLLTLAVVLARFMEKHPDETDAVNQVG